MWWLCFIYIYKYMCAYVYTWLWLCHGFYFTVMLHSTTGLYGRPMLEVAYGEISLSLHQGCMGDDSSKRVVGVSACCIVHARHTRVNTRVGSITLFSNFYDIKTYMYYAFKIYIYIYMVYKNTGGLWPRPDPMRFREWFWPPTNFI